MIKQGISAAEAEHTVRELEDDYQRLPLDAADRAILDYAVKLSLQPGSIGEDDIQTLREQGLDDLAIHDLCGITAYFAFVNRIADGLGVELEED